MSLLPAGGIAHKRRWPLQVKMEDWKHMWGVGRSQGSCEWSCTWENSESGEKSGKDVHIFDIKHFGLQKACSLGLLFYLFSLWSAMQSCWRFWYCPPSESILTLDLSNAIPCSDYLAFTQPHHLSCWPLWFVMLAACLQRNTNRAKGWQSRDLGFYNLSFLSN